MTGNLFLAPIGCVDLKWLPAQIAVLIGEVRAIREWLEKKE